MSDDDLIIKSILLERRMLTDSEYPLVLRVNLGPHENIARMYIFDKNLVSPHDIFKSDNRG